MPLVKIAVGSPRDQDMASTEVESVQIDSEQKDDQISRHGNVEGAGGDQEQETNVDKRITETEIHPSVGTPGDLGDKGDNTHVVVKFVNTVIVGKINPSGAQRESPSDSFTDKETDTQTDAHVTVETVTFVNRERSSDSPTNGVTDTAVTDGPQPQTDKRTNSRSSGKSSKKEKPTPFKKKDSVAKETLHANSPTPLSTERCDSSLSNTSMDQCRICQCDSCEIQNDSPLVAPCVCSGSLKFIHQACLQKWIKSSDKMSCELCQFEYQMTKKTKPFREWERLDMTSAERRKVVCSVTFHVIAITCVVWSLYVLIDRTTEEVEAGSLLWPFWTKLIVVAIGFTGGVVFMYVQCKMYLMLCKKWRMYNKVILISSISDTQRVKANHEGLLKIKEKQQQLESGHVTNFDVFNIVNETDSF